MEKEINYKINYKINYEIIYVSIVYIFIFAGLIYLSEGNIPRNYIAIVLFFFFKMVTMYDKCTISYIECKLRNVKKEDGYLYDFLHSIIILRDTPHAKFIYAIFTVLILFFIKQELKLKI